MTKQEAIHSLELSGYTYHGFKDIGWGQKYYHFTGPDDLGPLTYDLRNMRIRARHLQTKRWFDERKRELEFGIQQELFGPYEYLT